VLTLAIVSAVGASTSVAASIDLSSDRSALGAYHRYVSVLVGAAGHGARMEHRYVTGVRRGCRGVLTPLGSLTSSQIDRRALLQFGEEVGGDLAIAFDREALTPFRELTAALNHLKWSAPRSARTVASLLAAEDRSLNVPHSKLCSDARALVARPSTEPHGTHAFLATYLPAAKKSTRQLAPFLSLLARYQTPAEGGVIASIRALVTRFNAISRADEKLDSARVLAALGLR
jgi:hypothetical protein